MLTAIGVALGIPAAVCIGRGMRNIVVAITARDQLTLAAAAAFVLALGSRPARFRHAAPVTLTQR